jgi:hypothetical protein
MNANREQPSPNTHHLISGAKIIFYFKITKYFIFFKQFGNGHKAQSFYAKKCKNVCGYERDLLFYVKNTLNAIIFYEKYLVCSQTISTFAPS